MSKRKNRPRHRPRPEFLNRCRHCATERIIAPAAKLLAAARRYPLLAVFARPLEQAAAYYGPSTQIALCPGCFCITGDIYGSHAH